MLRAGPHVGVGSASGQVPGSSKRTRILWKNPSNCALREPRQLYVYTRDENLECMHAHPALRSALTLGCVSKVGTASCPRVWMAGCEMHTTFTNEFSRTLPRSAVQNFLQFPLERSGPCPGSKLTIYPSLTSKFQPAGTGRDHQILPTQ